MDKLLQTCVCILSAVVLVKCRVVKIKIGGRKVEVNGTIDRFPFGNDSYTIYKYVGLPFAKPPLGELRFKKPEPVDMMHSPFHAVLPEVACVQFNFDRDEPQTEDCLYLSVYVPGRPADTTSGHAVAVWIHGGGFIQGTGSQYDATFMSLYGNVIVVTINYRLGVYGFLTTEDENAPGNIALWDQHMAFKWVHDHIKSFGGDPDRVTIFGESAGAISASFHALIPRNRGLFHRIITQSGSVFIPTNHKVHSSGLERCQHLGEILDCEITPIKSLMKCLRNKSNDEIVKAIKDNNIEPTEFGLVIDNDLIKSDIKDMASLTNSQQVAGVEFYRSLDVMNGFNSHEGYIIASVFSTSLPQDMLITRQEMKALISTCLHVIYGEPLHPSVLEMLMAEYTNWTNPDSKSEVRFQLIKLLGDFLFGSPAIESTLLHASSTSGRNYLYHFVANAPFSPLETPEWLPGANHADEISFMFGIEKYLPNTDPDTSWEIQLSRKMVTYWTNFIKSGDPNDGYPVSPVWPEYNQTSQAYITLEENTTEDSVGHNLYSKENNFWFHVFPDINKALNTCGSTASRFVPSVIIIFTFSILSYTHLL
ncbi:Cocaine esterase [Mactra antiquata]